MTVGHMLIAAIIGLIVFLFVVHPRPKRSQYFQVLEPHWKRTLDIKNELNLLMGIVPDSFESYFRGVNPYPKLRELEAGGLLEYRFREMTPEERAGYPDAIIKKVPEYRLTLQGVVERNRLRDSIGS